MNHDEMIARRSELRVAVVMAENKVEACRRDMADAQVELARRQGALMLLEEVMATAAPELPLPPERKPRRDMLGMVMDHLRGVGPTGSSIEALAVECELKPTRAREVVDRLVKREQVQEVGGSPGRYRVNDFALTALVARA